MGTEIRNDACGPLRWGWGLCWGSDGAAVAVKDKNRNSQMSSRNRDEGKWPGRSDDSTESAADGCAATHQTSSEAVAAGSG